MQILTGRGSATKVKFDDRALLSELRTINQEAANKYLEYTVVKKRSAVGLEGSPLFLQRLSLCLQDKTLHNDLLSYYLDQAENFLSDDGVLYHFTEICKPFTYFVPHLLTPSRCIDDEYVKSRPNVTYCQYVAETAYDSPAKTLRMKTILFLQGSPFYDLGEAEKRLQSIDKLFYEKAIVYGRVGLFVPNAIKHIDAETDGKFPASWTSLSDMKKLCSCWLSECATLCLRRPTAHKEES